MAVTDKHPQYLAAKKSWQIMQDAIAGEEKNKGVGGNLFAQIGWHG
ncbi:hypothetical protein O4002_00855 [Providencia stuartii]|nr:hypothetical protein [Providencia stuartii]WAZ82919.1 hypothetical protein O4002_00855 [Providencia stuartii]